MQRVRRGSRLVAGALTVLALAGCSGGSGQPSAAGSSGASTSASASPATTRPHCPNPEGLDCLGTVAPGTYTTRTMEPTLTYTVPAGWANMEDTPGNFLLLPTSQTLPGVNAGTSDYIGVYTAVFPVNGCDRPDGDVTTPAAYDAWLHHRAGLVVSADHAVRIGGLSGRVADLRVAKGWTKPCEGSPIPTVTIESGYPPSSLVHEVLKGQAIRLCMFGYHRGVLAVEVDDVKDAGHLDTYSSIVKTFDFHQA